MQTKVVESYLYVYRWFRVNFPTSELRRSDHKLRIRRYGIAPVRKLLAHLCNVNIYPLDRKLRNGSVLRKPGRELLMVRRTPAPTIYTW
jgi:hypothetical protein